MRAKLYLMLHRAKDTNTDKHQVPAVAHLLLTNIQQLAVLRLFSPS